MSTFHERKAQRTEHYRRFVFGWRLQTCYSCNGSGRYDHNGSPPCSGCDGTGRSRYRHAGAAAIGNKLEKSDE